MITFRGRSDPFNWLEHNRETTHIVLITTLIRGPYTLLVIRQSFNPLPTLGTLGEVGCLGYHVKKGFAFVADRWHISLILLQTILVLFPPFTQLNVREFGDFEFGSGRFLLFFFHHGFNVGRQLCIF